MVPDLNWLWEFESKFRPTISLSPAITQILRTVYLWVCLFYFSTDICNIMVITVLDMQLVYNGCTTLGAK